MTLVTSCGKFPWMMCQGPLLLWGTVVAVPQMVPLLFIHSIAGAFIAAVPIGLMGGVGTAAYLDLIIRSCPRGLQGDHADDVRQSFWVSTRFDDVLGRAFVTITVALQLV